MSQEWIVYTIGELRADVRSLHGRVDAVRRELLGRIAPLERKRNGNGGKPLWVHLASLAAIYGLLLMSILRPEAAGALVGIIIKQLLH